MPVDGNGNNQVNPEDYRTKVAELATTIIAAAVSFDNKTITPATAVASAEAILLTAGIVEGDQPA